MNRARSLIVLLLIALPLVVAAIVVGVRGADPSEAWNTGEEVVGAPAEDDAITAADLVDARRATGEAAAQAGFLETGMGELAEGTTQLRDGSEQLTDGTQQLAAGAQELSNGMVQIQAGTAELGVGATQVADAVGTTVDAVISANAIRGQALAAIDRTLASLEDNPDPDAIRAAEDLRGLRDQLAVVELEGPLVTELESLRDGSREIANQLTTPGFAYHDGIYSATRGAGDLNAGLQELDAGVGEAVEGIGQLDDGAHRLASMAETNASNIGTIGRSIPAIMPGTDEDAPSQAISPIVALLIGAAAMLAGLLIGVAVRLVPERRWFIVGTGVFIAAVAGAVAIMIFGTGLSVAAVVLGTLALALVTVVAAGVTALLSDAFGLEAGVLVSAAVGIVQLGIVGWVWRVATGQDVAGWAHIVAALFPLHWSTSAVTAAGNEVGGILLPLGLLVLAAMAVISFVGLMPRKQLENR